MSPEFFEMNDKGYYVPTIKGMAYFLCIINRMSAVEPVDGSQNWWVFNDIAERMTKAAKEK